MFITKKSLPRRTVLKGAGATVALPFLEAMVPAFTATAQTAANPKRRFGAIYVPHGVILDQWTPATVGTGFEFQPIMKPLEPFRDQLLVVNNLTRAGTNADHAVAAGGWLSAADPKITEAEDVRLSTTLDQILAKHIGGDSPFPSLEIATEDFTGYVGGCSPGYSCAYLNTLSWTSPTTPVPMEINPRVVFERLFGRAGTSAQRRLRMQNDRSILDSLAEDVNDLTRGLGAQDQTRFSEYLEFVREIERRIQRTETQNRTTVAALDAPIGIPDAYGDHVALLFDLLVVAYAGDMTRVFTFMMARELSNKTYPEIGVTTAHHTISHHREKPVAKAHHAALNTYHVQLLAAFLDKMRKTQDGDGSLLDHSLICYGSGMGNGDVHGGDRLPFVAIGGGLPGGPRHVQLQEKTPVGNIWRGVADLFNCPLDRYGESNGKVTLLG